LLFFIMAAFTAKLIPAKFLSLMGNLLLFILISYSKDNNIYPGIRDSAGSGSDEYLQAKQSILAAASLGIICLVLELFLMLTGATLFFHRAAAMRKW